MPIGAIIIYHTFKGAHFGNCIKIALKFALFPGKEWANLSTSNSIYSILPDSDLVYNNYWGNYLFLYEISPNA